MTGLIRSLAGGVIFRVLSRASWGLWQKASRHQATEGSSGATRSGALGLVPFSFRLARL